MIATLRGRILQRQPTRLVVEVGGVGLEVHVPLPTGRTAGQTGEEIFLHTILVVREDALTLYGFAAEETRALFLKLTSVSGIGPRIALNALSGPSTEELVGALRDEDLSLLMRLPGIGKKTAQRMVVELKDSVAEFGDGGGVTSGRGRNEADALAALVSLGYQRGMAVKAVKKGTEGAKEEASVEEILRLALAALSTG